MHSSSDTALIELLKKDSKVAFEAIYRRYWEKLYLYAFKLSADRELSQNIVQDLFVSLWNKRASLSIEKLDTYLFQSVKYQIFKNYRDQKLSKEVLESRFEDFVIENPSVIDDSDLTQSLYTSINKLPSKRKEIFLMNKIHDLSVEQIASELALSNQTVKNQISSALKQLRLDLQDV
ncbi:RNA polymerase sigma-70 factor [Gilvimarinus agarilyticus]|nr:MULTISPECIES: RNA polymerase sigma-70 factor [Reichenbachiella]MBU2885911.1 RNA polymerase sigma-70 factor [Gilvimarinus agarilyticus]MBU2914559.1 RNA polymerase sigma-70 factor [Reichenbachiella agariperforans]RJE70606.1 RNA polymerase sigma-70 factor [Reichenbachiella sp. MSK19-1]